MRRVGPLLLVLAFAANSGHARLAAADPIVPGAAGCTALGAAVVPEPATVRTTYDGGSAAQPAHCIVRGSASPHTGVDGKAYETRFELRLPTMWSGRFLYQGGGGNDGIVAPAVGRNTGAFPETGLQRGFAVVTTDAGHQGGTPEFGLDPTARVDHAYASHERTATLALAIVARYYGRAPDRRYFVGCSGGGRQGMMFAQRYPSYFDGIAICAPAMRVSSGATIASAWDTQTYLSIAPSNAEGQRVLSRAFSDADLALVSRAIVAACDGDDGAMDWMVQRPDACRFTPKTLQCAGEKDATCLTLPQVAALERAFGGPRTSSGKALYVGQAWDPGIAAPGWRQWKLGTSQTGAPSAANATLMAGALAHEFFTPPDPLFAITSFDFDRDPARMEAFSAVFDTYRDATLAAFHKRGGKLLIFHGTADPIFSALESIDYYQRLARNNGGAKPTSAWARLFLVPGMNHCAGGPATDSFDGLGAITRWVEQGAAPERIEASALPSNQYFAGRPSTAAGGVPKRDVVVGPGGLKLKLGDTAVDVIATPGHTPGTLSYFFPVKDGGRTLMAAYAGGTAFNFPRRPENFAVYRDSQRKMTEVASAAGASVLITNHTEFDRAFDRVRLAQLPRAAEEKHPYETDAATVLRYFEMGADCAEAQRLSIK